MHETEDRAGDEALAENIALALHLNAKKLPKRRKGVAISYGEYGWLATAVVAALKLSGWRFKRKPPEQGIRSHE